MRSNSLLPAGSSSLFGNAMPDALRLHRRTGLVSMLFSGFCSTGSRLIRISTKIDRPSGGTALCSTSLFSRSAIMSLM